MSSEMSIPFRLNSSGRVVATSDQNSQVRLHVLALVNTNPVERVMVPGYGVEVNDTLFENDDDTDDEVSALVSTLLKESFSVWEPGVGLSGTSVGKDFDGKISSVNVNYNRKDAADSGTLANANVAIIGAGGTIKEIVRG